MREDFIKLLKYVLVGIWNTIFGVALYTAVILIFGEKHYLILSVLTNIIAITQSYLSYKFFVFKTKGSYIKEYLKIYVTYGVSMLISLLGMYVLVDFIKISAIYSNLIVTAITLIINFFMHKNFTFKR
jgi:putative flippase GtrA